MCRQPTQLFFLPVNIQFQPIHVPHDDYNRNLGPLGETSLSSLITSSAGTSGCTGLKRKLSPEAVVNAQNEKSEFISSPRYFTRPSIDNLKSFFEFHSHQPRANVPFNTERAFFRIDANGEKVHRQWLSMNRNNGQCAAQFASPSEKVPNQYSLATLMTKKNA